MKIGKRANDFDCFDALKWILQLRFVIDVQICETLTGTHEGAEVCRSFDERDTRQLAFEVGGVGRAIRRMMKQRVNVMEDVELGD